MRRVAGIAGVALLLGGAFTLGLFLTRAQAQERSAAPLPEAERDMPPDILGELREELLDAYYRPIPSTTLASETPGELVESLQDPYTEFLTPAAYEELQESTAGSYSGVGLTLERAQGGLVVKTAVHGPAREAGIRPGDLIVSVDGRGIDRMPFQRSLELFRGDHGTTVRLTIRRPREGKLNFAVARSEIALPTARAKLLGRKGSRVGYVRLLSFRTAAGEVVASRVDRLVERGASGVVLDLRGNHGGLLSEAVATVSLFVESGLVCVTEGLHHGRREYRVSGNAAHPDVPLVVLVDRESASAAEVVAAALEDHERALVVGQPTYGKATVQSLRELSNGSALKLTTAVFRTPSGTNLTGRGLSPNLVARDLPETIRDEGLRAAVRELRAKLDAAA
jgi:carboxyl-terminal processing protease